jgi:hypothetical protein
MNPQKQIEVLAELNGRGERAMVELPETHPIEMVLEPLPDYLNSYDAIIPLIKKLKDERGWSSNPADYPTWMFSGELLRMLKIKLYDNGTPLKSPYNLCQLIFMATPSQLCEAVLKAVHRWEN